MTARVSPTERIRAEIDELIAGSERGSLLEHFEEVARAAVRLVFQTALETEVTEFFGRERYARGERDREGSRNGYSDMTIKTTAGPITIERPKLRGTDEAFASPLLGVGVTRTNALESLVIAGFVRGLSVRDVEASLAEALGPEATLSKSTVAKVCEAIAHEFENARREDSGATASGCRLIAEYKRAEMRLADRPGTPPSDRDDSAGREMASGCAASIAANHATDSRSCNVCGSTSRPPGSPVLPQFAGGEAWC